MSRLISVLIPTRKRIPRLEKCIKSFEDNTKDYSKIELIFKIDNDDEETLKFICNYHHKIDMKYILSDRLNGYGNLHDFYYEMAKISSGEFLYIFNDDIYMKTFGWEEIVNKFQDRFCILAHNVYLQDDSPAVKANVVNNKLFTENFNGNPIFPKNIIDIWGFVPPVPIVDSWFSNIVRLLKLDNINIEHWVDIACECDRPDDHYGSSELDSTFLDGRQYTNWMNMPGDNVIKIYSDKIKKYLLEAKNKFEVFTKSPIALDSPDHLFPWGTMRDNTTDSGHIQELESYFNKKINLIDLGCSGGKFVRDLNENGNLAIGLEGSDYSIKNKRVEWPDLHNKKLFTCDITEPFFVTIDRLLFKADVISAWEVLEHINSNKINILLSNIKNHLKEDGIFIGSVSMNSDKSLGTELHQMIFPKEYWYNVIFSDFETFEYPLTTALRHENNSFNFMLKLKK